MNLLVDRGLTRRGWLFSGLAATVAAGPLAGCHRGGRSAAPGPQTTLSAQQSDLILKTLSEAPSHGFSPSAFPTAGLADGLRSDAAASQARLASDIVAYARAQHGLSIPRSAMDKNWAMRPAAYDAEAAFHTALAQNRLAQWLASLPPPDPRYELLRRGYVTYLKVADAGGWPNVPDGPPLKVGSRGARVAALRKRLAFEDAMVARSRLEAPYDHRLAGAVSQFQDRHGLKPTGVVDGKTIAAMNVPAIARAAQIRANLERWRWAPRPAPASRIEVNSAGQTLDLYLDGQPAMHMLTAAGKPGDETPIVASKIHTVVLNPTWNVPDDIAQEELYPKGGDYLQAHNFTETNGRLVQQPGPDNALGRVKFLFNNDFAIYLHDTPAKWAFTKDQRSVSHGCVRLQKAIDLAKLLLNRIDGWSPDRVDEVLAGTDTVNVDLKQQMPVEIFYWTAWPQGDQLAFRDDIYGWDQETLQALDASQVSRA